MERKLPYATLKWLALLAGICFISFPLKSQDIHFSQFYNAEMHQSPALTPVHDADLRFTATGRGQWSNPGTLPSYRTLFASGARNFQLPNTDKRFFAGGLGFQYDEAGFANLNLAHLSLSGAFVQALDSNRVTFLSVGLYGSVNQRSFKPSELTWGEQYIDGSFVAGAPTGENITNNNRFFVSTGVGVNFHGKQRGKRSTLNTGVGLFHLNRPNQSFYRNDQDARLPMRWSVYFQPTVQLIDVLDLVLAGSAQFQGPYSEFLGVTAVRLHLSQRRAREVAIQVGGGVRFNSFGDAIIPSAELHLHSWRIAASYDINISEFDVATNGRGGPEISVRYLIRYVPPMDFKTCRLY